MTTTRVVLGTAIIPAEPEAVAGSRHWIAHLLNGNHAAIRDGVVLLVSELVTNAIRYADPGPVTIVAIDLGDAVRVEVTDAGSATSLPQVLDNDPETLNGRGLDMVDMISARWGTSSDRTCTTVWFELAVTERGTPDASGG